jgi:transposase
MCTVRVPTSMGLIGHLDEIPGIGPATAQVILAEVGLDMNVFPTPDHLVSWAKLCPRTIQSGNKNTSGKTGKGNSWLKRALGEAAMAAAKTDTFLGARYRRLVKRKGHAKALSPSPARCWSSSGTSSTTPPPATPTSGPITTNAGPIPPARPVTWSANSKPSATR